MPTRKQSFREFTSGLHLTGPRENVPAGHLRRAKSIYPLRGGSILSRSPHTLLYSLNAHSLFRFQSKRIAGVGTQVYSNGALTGAPTQNGNRLRFLEIAARFLSTNPLSTETDLLYVAGGGAPFKTNAAVTTFQNWGIRPPTPAEFTPSFAPAAQLAKTIETFDAIAGFTAEAINATTDLPTSALAEASEDSVRFVQGTKSIKVKVAANVHIELRKAIAAPPLDLTTFTGGAPSADEDYINFAVRVNRPAHIRNIELKFFVGAGPFDPTLATGPFEDYYYRELHVKTVRPRRRRKLRGTGDFIRKKDIQEFLDDNSKGLKGDLSTLEFLDDDFGTFAVSKRTWTNVTLPKSAFETANRAGTSGFTWANVIGLQVSVETTKAGGAAVWFDGMRLSGGVGTRGDYLYTFTFRNDTLGIRSNPIFETDGTLKTYPIANIDRTGIDITGLPAGPFGNVAGAPSMPITPDTQISHIEIWRNIGNGGLQFFKAGQVAVGTTTFTDNASDYIGMFSGTGGTYLDNTTALALDNAPFGVAMRDGTTDTTDYCTQAVYHPPTGRVFGLSLNFPSRLFYSPAGRPESLASFIEPTTPDDPIQALVAWTNNLYAFSRNHVYEIVNTDEPFTAIEVFGAPGTVQPFTVRPSPMGVLYWARDGARLFTGNESRVFGQDQLSTISRGATVSGHDPFTAVVSEYGRTEAYFSDADVTTYAYDFRTESWRNVGTAAKAFYYEHETGVLLASALECVVTGMLLVRGGGTLNIAIPTPPSYIVPANPIMGTATTVLAEAQIIAPAAITITALYVQLSDALDASESVSFRINVNGVDSSGITLNMTTGDTTKGATGTVEIAAGDLWTVSIPSRTLNTEAVTSIGIAYTIVPI